MMKEIRMDLGDRSYPILLDKGIIGELKNYVTKYEKIILVSNTKVGALYSEKVLDILENTGKNISYFEISDGEEHKSIESAFGIYDFMVENDFDRSSLIISLGGGVITDLGGYVAATYMRGIDFIQIPTSLLSQVDASIGGKVAVNHPKAKNLIGAFYQPKLVLIDVDFLKTLPEKEFKAGMGEIIKHSFLKDDDYYDYLVENAQAVKDLQPEEIIEVIKRSCVIKKNIVEEDEKEKGIRAIVNLGHTYAHALETATEYKGYSHGEAVAKGIIYEILLSQKLGYVEKEFLDRGKIIFDKYEIDCEPVKIEIERLIALMKKDKKNTGGKIKFVLPTGKGTVSVEDVSEDIIREINQEIDNRVIKGVVDIGTNSCRLFISEVEKNENKYSIKRKFRKYLEITKLGEDVNKNGYLLDSAINRTVDVLKNYSEKMASYGVAEKLVCATSATRDSSNREDFIRKVKNESGLEIKCITGDEEASLSFKGASDDIEGELLLIDIGGGSTEFINGSKNDINFMKSFDIGAVRVTEKFFVNDNHCEENIKLAEQWVKSQIKEAKDLSKRDFILVGVAGTVTTNVTVYEKMVDYDPEKVHMYNLTMANVEENIKLYLSKNIEERKKIKGLPPKRAEVIIAGTFILKWIMETLERDEILVSENDILEGMMES
ncbi:3-dehydroquinate synthase [Ilyobacter polytropus DSM 2926]|uniref:3-dehydroquinate synthase n=2 Tax=Ilyobacter TaxID=167639 RepID=E3H8K0_ILYPC|nr:3-dehydroquinate synthase [Ilyobacter polytropus DSM 2926]